MLKRIEAILATLLLAGSTWIPAASPSRPEERPDVRLLSMHLFWIDGTEPPIQEMTEVSRSSLLDRWEMRHYDYGQARVLSAGHPGDWQAGEGSALVIVPRLGERWAHYTLTTAFRDPEAGRRYRVDSVVGTRARGKYGTVHTLDLARVAALPRFARDEVGDLVNPQLMERSVYWEAAFELPGMRRDEIKRIDALGPGLIKPPKKWLQVLDSLLQAPEVPQQAEGHNCIGIGPLRLCLNIPDLATSLSRSGWLKERNEVRLTRSLWHAGDASGVVVVGRLIDYSIVTFRIRTNGKGSHPKGVVYLTPFRLSGELGVAPRESDPLPESPGRMLQQRSLFDRPAVARQTTLDRSGYPRPASPRDHRPGSLSLESILARAFSPERE